MGNVFPLYLKPLDRLQLGELNIISLQGGDRVGGSLTHARGIQRVRIKFLTAWQCSSVELDAGNMQ